VTSDDEIASRIVSCRSSGVTRVLGARTEAIKCAPSFFFGGGRGRMGPESKMLRSEVTNA